MKLPFSKHKQPQPIINNPYNQDTVAMPVPATTVLPAIETVKTVVYEMVWQCAHCHVDGAKHLIHSGDFYIGAVEWYLCDACHKERIRKHLIHVTSQRKTRIETPAVKMNGGVVKPGIAIVGEPGPEIVTIPRDAVVMPNKPQVEKPTFKVFLDGRELA